MYKEKNNVVLCKYVNRKILVYESIYMMVYSYFTCSNKLTIINTTIRQIGEATSTEEW